MKSKFLVIALAGWLACCICVAVEDHLLAQDVIRLDDGLEFTPTPDVTPQPQPVGEASHADRTCMEIEKAIRESNEVGPVRKSLALLALRRSASARQVACDYVTKAAIDRGAIDIEPPPPFAGGEFDQEQAITADWEQILAIIIELLPILLQILLLF